jgi:hypothetical protein
LDDKFLDEMVRVSKLYAVRKGRMEVEPKLTHNTMRTSIAVMYMTGYLCPSNRRMYWEQREDTMNSFVKKAISRNLFTSIIQNTSFVDRITPDPSDKFWKVRPLFQQLNKTAKAYVRQSQNVSVDEGIIKYFGPHPLKQYMKGKPHRFGYKVWILATAEGELLACQPYGGASTNIKDFGLGQGPNVVLGLSTQYKLLPGTKVYVDNLFTSMDLLDHMGDRQWGVTGTLRQNRIIGIPLPGKKEATRNMKRGEAEAVYSSDSTVIVWKDNQPVYMASNCDTLHPMGQCQRYSSKDKRYMPFPQPLMNHLYNRSMGGVDLVDNSEKNYAITTRIKKWYWCIYAWFLNICMVQAWRLYRAHMKARHQLMQVAAQLQEEEVLDDSEKRDRESARKRRRTEERKLEEISLLEFTRQVVVVTIKKHGGGEGVEEPVPFQHHVASSRLAPAELEAIRYDRIGHLITKPVPSVSGVCKVCKKRSRFRCVRCKVCLHPECFINFHVREEERMLLQ